MKELLPQIASPPGDVISSPSVVASTNRATVAQQFPDNLPDELNLVLGQTGNAYATMMDEGNPYVLPVGSKLLNNLIRARAKQFGFNLRQNL